MKRQQELTSQGGVPKRRCPEPRAGADILRNQLQASQWPPHNAQLFQTNYAYFGDSAINSFTAASYNLQPNVHYSPMDFTTAQFAPSADSTPQVTRYSNGSTPASGGQCLLNGVASSSPSYITQNNPYRMNNIPQHQPRANVNVSYPALHTLGQQNASGILWQPQQQVPDVTAVRMPYARHTMSGQRIGWNIPGKAPLPVATAYNSRPALPNNRPKCSSEKDHEEVIEVDLLQLSSPSCPAANKLAARGHQQLAPIPNSPYRQEKSQHKAPTAKTPITKPPTAASNVNKAPKRRSSAVQPSTPSPSVEKMPTPSLQAVQLPVPTPAPEVKVSSPPVPVVAQEASLTEAEINFIYKGPYDHLQFNLGAIKDYLEADIKRQEEKKLKAEEEKEQKEQGPEEEAQQVLCMAQTTGYPSPFQPIDLSNSPEPEDKVITPAPENKEVEGVPGSDLKVKAICVGRPAPKWFKKNRGSPIHGPLAAYAVLQADNEGLQYKTAKSGSSDEEIALAPEIAYGDIERGENFSGITKNLVERWVRCLLKATPGTNDDVFVWGK